MLLSVLLIGVLLTSYHHKTGTRYLASQTLNLSRHLADISHAILSSSKVQLKVPVKVQTSWAGLEITQTATSESAFTSTPVIINTYTESGIEEFYVIHKIMLLNGYENIPVKPPLLIYNL